MKHLYLLLLCFFSLFLIKGFAQDANLSQFYLTPPSLNPSLVGANCGGRLMANYRNQWWSSLGAKSSGTYILSYDQAIGLKNGDKLGVGGNLLLDQAGQSNLKLFKGGVSIAYHKKIKTNSNTVHYLRSGVNTEIANRSIDLGNLAWGSQHNGNGGFDPNLPGGGDELDRTNFNYLDIDLGIGWQADFSNGNMVQVNFSVAHINGPNQSFNTTDKIPLYKNYAAFGMASITIAKNLALIPRWATFFQGPSFEGVFGTGGQLFLNEDKNKAIELGAMVSLANRIYITSINQETIQTSSIWMDALIFNLNYHHPKFIIGLSYDQSVGNLKAGSSGLEKMEITIAYLFCKTD